VQPAARAAARKTLRANRAAMTMTHLRVLFKLLSASAYGCVMRNVLNSVVSAILLSVIDSRQARVVHSPLARIGEAGGRGWGVGKGGREGGIKIFAEKGADPFATRGDFSSQLLGATGFESDVDTRFKNTVISEIAYQNEDGSSGYRRNGGIN